jgi:hypothetical protein
VERSEISLIFYNQMEKITFVVSYKSINNSRSVKYMPIRCVSGKGPEGNHRKEKFEMTPLEQL